MNITRLSGRTSDEASLKTINDTIEIMGEQFIIEHVEIDKNDYDEGYYFYYGLRKLVLTVEETQALQNL